MTDALRKRLLKIYLENYADINEERKDDAKYANQALELYNHCLDAIVKIGKPDEENIYETSKIGLPFDVVFIYAPHFEYNAQYRRNYKDDISIIIINCKAFKQLYDVEDYSKIFNLMENVIIHEIIHYIDMDVRIFKVDPEKVSQVGVNHPVEFNAYFQQVASKYYNMVNSISKSKNPLDEFDTAIGKNARDFFNRFMSGFKSTTLYKVIDKNEIFRWNKRAYDLYFNLKDDLFDKVAPDDVKKDIIDIEESIKRKK